MSPLDKKDRRSIINVGHQLHKSARRGSNDIFQKFLKVYTRTHMVRLTVYRIRIRLPMQTTRSEVRIGNKQYFLSRKQKTEGAFFLRGLAASNLSGRYDITTSHNSLKRYSCLWTLAINGVAVSPAILRFATEGTKCEKIRESKTDEGGRRGRGRLPCVHVRVLIISIIVSTGMCMLHIPLDF